MEKRVAGIKTSENNMAISFLFISITPKHSNLGPQEVLIHHFYDTLLKE
jgi:hypothetical protein